MDYNKQAEMVKIEKLIVGEMKTNCYIVSEEKTGEALIIDPGDEAELIMNKVRDLEICPVMIVATHGHYDHVMAANELKAAYEIPLLMNRKDEKILNWMRSSAMHYLGQDPGPKPIVDKYIGEKDMIKIGEIKLEIIETPGHTPGGICLYNKEHEILFSGDTIFARGGVGRTDFSYSNKTDLDNSIKTILDLPNKTRVYSGHGAMSIIGFEKKYYYSQK